MAAHPRRRSGGKSWKKGEEGEAAGIEQSYMLPAKLHNYGIHQIAGTFSLHMALIEYAYVIAHLLFYATMLFDFDGLELMTTTADVLFIDSCLGDVYEPNDLIAKRNGEIMMQRISAN
uniref:Uncharacterized protein n=1 Tax=Ascaris lumbricoides TaxID=6252 RepID=A0A0M3HZR2_ASCLU